MELRGGLVDDPNGAGSFLEGSEPLIPGEIGPAELGSALTDVVGDGVERAQAAVAVGREERRLEEALDEPLGARRLGHESLEGLLPLDAPRGVSVLVPLDAPLMVRRSSGRRELDLAIRGEVRRAHIARDGRRS